MTAVTAPYEEEPADAPIPCRVVLEVALNGESAALVEVSAMDPGAELNARQEQEAVERAMRFYERTANLPEGWAARTRVQRPRADV